MPEAVWPPDRPVLFLGGPWHGRLHVTPMWHTYWVVNRKPRDDAGFGWWHGETLYYLEWFVPFSVSPAVRYGWGRPRFPVYVLPSYHGPMRWR